MTDWQARVNLALSLLQQRPANEQTVELAVMALRGATVEQLVAWESAA